MKEREIILFRWDDGSLSGWENRKGDIPAMRDWGWPLFYIGDRSITQDDVDKLAKEENLYVAKADVDFELETHPAGFIYSNRVRIMLFSPKGTNPDMFTTEKEEEYLSMEGADDSAAMSAKQCQKCKRGFFTRTDKPRRCPLCYPKRTRYYL